MMGLNFQKVKEKFEANVKNERRAFIRFVCFHWSLRSTYDLIRGRRQTN